MYIVHTMWTQYAQGSDVFRPVREKMLKTSSRVFNTLGQNAENAQRAKKWEKKYKRTNAKIRK